MLDSFSPTQLANLLEDFSFPMLIAERLSPEADFTLTTCNASAAKIFAAAHHSAQHRSFADVMTTDDAQRFQSKFALCAKISKDIRCREKLTVRGREQQVDLALQCQKSQDGSERIIGMMMPVRHQPQDSTNRLVYDDIKYFSVIADLQLLNLISMFEAAYDQDLFTMENRVRVEKLSGVCRTVQRAVADIRSRVEGSSTEIAAERSNDPDPVMHNAMSRDFSHETPTVSTIHALQSSTGDSDGPNH